MNRLLPVPLRIRSTNDVLVHKPFEEASRSLIWNDLKRGTQENWFIVGLSASRRERQGNS